MKKISILLIATIGFLFADSALLLKKGWQLVGTTSKITDMSIFESKNVDTIWHFDASTQRWKGYSPDKKVNKKIQDKGNKPLKSLESWHGFWIKNKKDWTLSFKTDTTDSDDTISLKKGWNLISLPINTAVSPHIFNGLAVWKYSKEHQWEMFSDKPNKNYPLLSHISNADGIWVKSDKDQNISTIENAAKLHNFTTEAEIKKYIREMLLKNSGPIYYPMFRGGNFRTATLETVSTPISTSSVSSKSADNASGTNLQEKGVDESDILKHDGTNIFYISKNTNNYNDSTINITTFDTIIANNLKPKNTIKIKGDVNALYLINDKLIVLSRPSSIIYGKDETSIDVIQEKKLSTIRPYRYSPPKTEVLFYDVSDISNIRKTASYILDGNIDNSRVVDGKLFLISSFIPYVNYTYPKVYIEATECKEYIKVDSYIYDKDGKYTHCYNMQKDEKGYFRYDYKNPTISSEYLLPHYTENNGTKKILLSPERFLAPAKKDQRPNITSVTAFDIESKLLQKNTSVLGYNNTLYASKNALYLVSNSYPRFFNFDRYEERSSIKKIALDENLSYEASGFVKGRVLNQFSLSEYQETLRIATTEGNSWQNDTNNALYTLKQEKDKLSIYGSLSGLGKEGETIRSVRFMQNRGYIVTFRQTDPFYTIDLSDPKAPTKAGELEIDGFSSYLHPVDDNHILGIGRDATPDGQTLGLKMELFDISDFANPKSVDTHSFGGKYSYGEIEHNHKALAYRQSDALLGFAYRAGNDYDNIKNSYGVFQIEDSKINAFKSIDSPNTNKNNYGQYSRGVIFDIDGETYIAYFSNGQIAYNLLSKLK